MRKMATKSKNPKCVWIFFERIVATSKKDYNLTNTVTLLRIDYQ